MKRLLVFVLGPPVVAATCFVLAYAVFLAGRLAGWVWALLPAWMWAVGAGWIFVGLVCLLMYEDRAASTVTVSPSEK